MAGCLHLRCTVKKLRLFRYHTLSPPPPPFLPPSCKILRERLISDWRDILQPATLSLRCTHLPESLYFTNVFQFPRTLSLRNYKISPGRIPKNLSSWWQDRCGCRQNLRALLLYGLCSLPVSQGDVQVLVHRVELPTSHQPCPGLTNASTAAGMGSENWLSPKTGKSYYTRA